MVRHGLRTVLSLRLLRGGKVRLHGLLADEQHRVQQLRGAELLARGPSGLHELPDDAGRLRLAQRHGPDELRLQLDSGLRMERDEPGLRARALHPRRKLEQHWLLALRGLLRLPRGLHPHRGLHCNARYFVPSLRRWHLVRR